jgi:hypothetical protein
MHGHSRIHMHRLPTYTYHLRVHALRTISRAMAAVGLLKFLGCCCRCTVTPRVLAEQAGEAAVGCLDSVMDFIVLLLGTC